MTNIDFNSYDVATLTSMIHDAPGTAFVAMVPDMKIALKAAKLAAVKLEESTATRELASQQYAMLQAVMASKVATVASPEGTAYRRNFSAVVSLVEDGWDVPTLKARHAVTALVDTSPATKDVTDLDSAVTFAAENAKSDIYSA